MGNAKVVILGVNGHVGKAIASAFLASDWDVTGMARTDKHALPGMRFVQGDSDSIEDMRRAIGDAEIVVNALNLPYATWFDGRMEAQMARVLEAMGKSGKTMLFPGNIYNFAADSDVLTPDLPQHPPTPRGAIRVRVEAMYQAAAERGDIQFIVLRAGDFYGPNTKLDWFDQIMMTGAKSRKVSVVGTPGVGHSWAYLPDLGRAFEALASIRTTLGPFERFHFAGNHVTPEEMAAAIVKAAPVPVKTSVFPFILMRLLGLIDPTIREVNKMRYLWRNPLKLTDPRLDALLGPGFNTPFTQAIAATVTPFFERAGLEAKASPNVVRRLA
jgi:nucleoside-diphosphate-sugar epimerase